MRILFDTNIILDIALNRNPYFIESSQAFRSIDRKNVQGYSSANTITDIYYIAKRQVGHDTAISFIIELISIVDIVGIDKAIIIDAVNLDFKDFEDAIQAASAEFAGIDYILTRNLSDFTLSQVPAISPSEFLSKLK